VALGLLLAATALHAQGSVPAGYQQSSTPLAAGVDHETLTLADPAQSVHVARVAPGAARLVAVSSHDAVANQDVGAELPSDMCRRVGCFAGINADFHDAVTGQPLGGVVSGGRLVRSPVPGRPQLIVTRDGHLQAGPLDWSGSVTASDNHSVAVGGVNVAPLPGDVVLYTPAWGASTPGGADTELVVRSSGAVGAIGATLLTMLNRRVSWSLMRDAAQSTARTTTLVIMILFCSTFFSLVFNGLGGTDFVTEILVNLPGGFVAFMIVSNIVVFLLGIFLEFVEISFIVMPLFVPAATHLGIDMVWFGVVMAINLQTAFISPPVGFSLFYLQSVAPKEVRTIEIHRGAVPFMVLQLIVLVVVMFYPPLVTWLVGASAG